MKKSTRVVVLSLLTISGVAGNATAQIDVSAGVMVGVNIANTTYTSTLSPTSKSARPALLLGGIVEIGVSRVFSIRTGPMFTQNGATIEVALPGAVFRHTYKLGYLEIPVHLKAHVDAGTARPYIFAGPSLGILLTASIEDEIPTALAQQPELRKSGTRDIKNQISSTNFSIDVGAGMAYKVSVKVSLLADVRYSLGLSNIAKPPDPNDQSFQPETWKSRDIKLLAGILFAL